MGKNPYKQKLTFDENCYCNIFEGSKNVSN